MEQFTAAFAATFTATANILAYAAGVVAAILIPAIAALATLGVLAWLFDITTAAIGRRWHKRGKEPRSKLGKIIYQRSGDV